ncbi:MAG: PD-(D/E)XK nuclease family protein [Candidatus Moranbacteria bacterium]|nr:PD-(D/E)XK nuclease family protein [Candidatus Moranbacteria bacterium]
MHTSYSALNTFLTCPLKYKFQAIDKIKTPKKPAQLFGSLVHATLKFIHSPGLQGFPDAEKALDYFSKNWKAENFPAEESQNYFREGVGIIQKYYQTLSEEERHQTIALEHRFIIPIKKHTLGGFIDRIDRTATGFEIIDYKTDRKVPPQEKIDQDLQLSIYLKAFIHQWPSLFSRVKDTDKINLTLFYLRHGLKLSTTRTSKDLSSIESNILEDIERLEKAHANNRFDPKINALCDWCDYQKLCPMFSHKYKVPGSQPKEKEIQEIGQQFIQLKAEKRKLEKEIGELGEKLAAYLEQEKIGQFFTEKGSILKQLRETYKYDSAEVVKLFGEWKKNPFSVMKVDLSALNRFAKRLSPEQKRELARLRKLEKQSYFLTVKNP